MKLGIFGGKPVAKPKDFYAWPNVTKEEIKELGKKFKEINSRNYKIDKDVINFEKAFSDFIGTKYCSTFNSGTSALFGAVYSCGLKEGENIVVPAYCFFSAATAVLNNKLNVKFCDINLETFNIDIESLKKTIDEKTRAILVVHMFGNPCEMDEINKIAKKNNLKVIEDACQAHGATYKNRKIGSIGDLGVFSFHISKNLPVMEGGAITTNSLDLRDKIISLGLFPDPIEKFYPPKGNNLRFNPLFAKIALMRLGKLEEYNNSLTKNTNLLREKISKYSFIIPQKINADSKSSNVLFVFRLDDSMAEGFSSIKEFRNRFVLALHKEGIPCGIWLDKIVPQMESFTQVSENFPNAQKLVDSSIFISGLTYPNNEKQVELIISAIDKIIKNINELKK